MLCYSRLVVLDRVVVHLIQLLAEEWFVLLGEMDELETTLNISVKLLATHINLIRRMDMLVNELADKLYLLVAA